MRTWRMTLMMGVALVMGVLGFVSVVDRTFAEQEEILEYEKTLDRRLLSDNPRIRSMARQELHSIIHNEELRARITPAIRQVAERLFLEAASRVAQTKKDQGLEFHQLPGEMRGEIKYQCYIAAKLGLLKGKTLDQFLLQCPWLMTCGVPFTDRDVLPELLARARNPENPVGLQCLGMLARLGAALHKQQAVECEECCVDDELLAAITDEDKKAMRLIFLNASHGASVGERGAAVHGFWGFNDSEVIERLKELAATDPDLGWDSTMKHFFGVRGRAYEILKEKGITVPAPPKPDALSAK